MAQQLRFSLTGFNGSTGNRIYWFGRTLLLAYNLKVEVRALFFRLWEHHSYRPSFTAIPFSAEW